MKTIYSQNIRKKDLSSNRDIDSFERSEYSKEIVDSPRRQCPKCNEWFEVYRCPTCRGTQKELCDICHREMEHRKPNAEPKPVEYSPKAPEKRKKRKRKPNYGPRKCSKCGLTKDEKDFTPSSNWCKSCRSDYGKEMRKKKSKEIQDRYRNRSHRPIGELPLQDYQYHGVHRPGTI